MDRPTANHFSETLNGRSTIKAFGSQQFAIDADLRNQNHCLVTQKISFATWVWYSMQMKISSLILMIVTASFCVFDNKVQDTVVIAIAFQYIVQLGDLMTGFIHNVGNMEGKLINIGKVLKLLEIPQENREQPKCTDEQWPQKGALEIKDLQIRYRPTTEQVLKGLTFKVKPGHKVGVVGRTGAGKSTLSMALTRIVEAQSGSINIDGVNIGQTNLCQVRDKITIIP